jgi:hypothetical protein
MFSRSVNDTSRVVRMTIIRDATSLSVTSYDSIGFVYDPNIFIMQATGVNRIKLFSSFVTNEEAKYTIQV